MEINEFHAGLFDPSNHCDCFKAARCDSFIITFRLKGASCFGSSFVALSACHTMWGFPYMHKFGVDKGFSTSSTSICSPPPWEAQALCSISGSLTYCHLILSDSSPCWKGPWDKSCECNPFFSTLLSDGDNCGENSIFNFAKVAMSA